MFRACSYTCENGIASQFCHAAASGIVGAYCRHIFCAVLFSRKGGVTDIFWCPLAMHMCYILFFHVCVCLYVSVCDCLCVCALACLFVCLFVGVFVCVFVYLFVCLFVCVL